MNLNDLYSYAEENNIPVISFDMPKSESMSVLYDGNCYVGIDRLTKQPKNQKPNMYGYIRQRERKKVVANGITVIIKITGYTVLKLQVG